MGISFVDQLHVIFKSNTSRTLYQLRMKYQPNRWSKFCLWPRIDIRAFANEHFPALKFPGPTELKGSGIKAPETNVAAATVAVWQSFLSRKFDCRVPCQKRVLSKNWRVYGQRWMKICEFITNWLVPRDFLALNRKSLLSIRANGDGRAFFFFSWKIESFRESTRMNGTWKWRDFGLSAVWIESTSFLEDETTSRNDLRRWEHSFKNFLRLFQNRFDDVRC